MSGPQPPLPTFYRPAEVAAMLRCSEWWVKEQARRRRVPFCWIGGSYRFTQGHIAELARLFEVRPAGEPGVPVAAAAPARRTARTGGEPSFPLRARVPRRFRDVDTSGSTAA